MLVTHLISESVRLPGMSTRRFGTGRLLEYNAGTSTGTICFYHLFPGIVLGYVSARMAAWPLPKLREKYASHRVLVVSHCISGRCQIPLAAGESTFLNSGEVALHSEFAMQHYFYPKGSYEGLVLIVDLDVSRADYEYLMRDFSIDPERIAALYCPDGAPYISAGISAWKHLMQQLWNLSQKHTEYALVQMRLCVISAMALLQNHKNGEKSRQGTFLTESQHQIAEQAHQILCADLSRRYSARELAEKFGISESSLKNYFSSVYGKNFSVFLRDTRMQKSADLLAHTQLTVAQVAAQVGYSHQGKFAEVFKSYYGIPPLEYRRLHHLV